jgi:hypothetical protein
MRAGQLNSRYGEMIDVGTVRDQGRSRGTSRAAMSIWLGKQYLGQREPVQQIEQGAP